MLLLDLPDAILFQIASLLLHDTENDSVFGLQDFERALHPMQSEMRFLETFVESLTGSTCDISHENARVMLALATLTSDPRGPLCIDPFLMFAHSCSKLTEISTSLLGIPKQFSISSALTAIQQSKRDRNHHLHAAAWSHRHSSNTAFSSNVAQIRPKRALSTQLALKRNQQKESSKELPSEQNLICSIDPTWKSFKFMATPSDDALRHSFFADTPQFINTSLSLHEALETGAFGATFALPDGVYDCRKMVLFRNNKLMPCSEHRVVFQAGMIIDTVSATIRSCVFHGHQGDAVPLVLVESGSILFENCVFIEASTAVKISNRNRLNRIGHSQPIVHFVNCFFHSCYTCLDSGDDKGFTGIMAVHSSKFVNCVSCITGMGASWVSRSVFENCSSAIYPSTDSKTILIYCTFNKCSNGILMHHDALITVKKCLFSHCYSAGAHVQFDRVSILSSHFCECFVGVLISKSSKSHVTECKFSCCGLAGVQVSDESAPTLTSCISNSCFVGFSLIDNSRPQIHLCTGMNDSHSVFVCHHSSPHVTHLKVFDSKHGASASSDGHHCLFLECVFEKCSVSAFSAHSSFFGVCESCEARDCVIGFSAVVGSRGMFKNCKATSCHLAFQLEGVTKLERCLAEGSSCGFTGGGLSESVLTHCQALRCEVGIIVCGKMSVQFCKIGVCQEGIVCSGLQQSIVMKTQVVDCPTGLALLKLGSVHQCQILRSSLHGVRFDPSCDVLLKNSSIKNCYVGIFNRFGGGFAHSCALQLCDVGIVLEGEVLTNFESCIMDQNQKGCSMAGVFGSGSMKSCIFKRSRIFGLGLLGQGDPGFVISESTFIENTTGVVYDCTAAPLFVQNTVTKNLLSGVLFKPGCCVIFRQNRMIGNKGHGMQVMSNSSCVIEDNVADKNDKFGVFFLTSQGVNDVIFRRNFFNGNRGGGINVAPGSQGRITEW
jgi:hypothetical protein